MRRRLKMGRDCPRCKGQFVFSDGAMEHEPRFDCVNCDYSEVGEEIKE